MGLIQSVRTEDSVALIASAIAFGMLAHVSFKSD